MKFGLGLTTRGIFADRETYLTVARAADKAGFDFLAVTDHLITPKNQVSKYPYTPDGSPLWSPDNPRSGCSTSLTPASTQTPETRSTSFYGARLPPEPPCWSCRMILIGPAPSQPEGSWSPAAT